MKKIFCFIFFMGICIGLQANDSIKNNISLKFGYAFNGGGYFSVAYTHHLCSLVSISPTFVYANTLLFSDDVMFSANQDGVNYTSSNSSGRVSTGLMLDVLFSSKAFSSPHGKHSFLLGLGLGVVNTVEVSTTYLPSSHYFFGTTKVLSSSFGQHLSLNYCYRLSKRVELGIFGDIILKLGDDLDGGVGLSCSVLF